MILIGSGYFLMMGGAAILTVSAYRQAKAPLHRNRNLYWVLALACTVIRDDFRFSPGWRYPVACCAWSERFSPHMCYSFTIWRMHYRQVSGFFIFLIVSAISLVIYILVFVLAPVILENSDRSAACVLGGAGDIFGGGHQPLSASDRQWYRALVMGEVTTPAVPCGNTACGSATSSTSKYWRPRH